MKDGPRPPEFVKDGARVQYTPSRRFPTVRYLGTVSGDPTPSLGVLGGWIVRLVEMDPSYQNGRRSDVPMVSVDCISPAPAQMKLAF